MYHRDDQLVKNLLRDALSRACASETEVEVLAATQKIDVYAVPDPARLAALGELGLLGELAAEPSLFEPFHETPSLGKVRRCLNKQHTWHHELERRARARQGSSRAGEGGAAAAAAATVAFPALVVIGPGEPTTVLEAYGCREVAPGVYHGVWGLALRVVVLSQLPRTRATLLLRLLGTGRIFQDALSDLRGLPDDAWERGVVMPLLVHFQLDGSEPATTEEESMSAEIQAWFKEYERKLRSESKAEGERESLQRLLRVRFGELPAAAVARIAAAGMAEIERWGERMFTARSVDEVLGEPEPS